MKRKKSRAPSKAKKRAKKSVARTASKKPAPPRAARARASAVEKYSQPGAPWWKAHL